MTMICLKELSHIFAFLSLLYGGKQVGQVPAFEFSNYIRSHFEIKKVMKVCCLYTQLILVINRIPINYF